MHVFLVLAELAATLRREIARCFETKPRMSTAVAATIAILGLFVLWSILSAIVWPPKRNVYGSVAGTVISVTGSPVANATVLFVNEAAGAGASGRTDAGGGYRAQGVPPGRYAVAIQPVVNVGSGELTKEMAEAARSQLETSVPLKFQDAATSGLTVELQRGRNRYDVNLSGKR